MTVSDNDRWLYGPSLAILEESCRQLLVAELFNFEITHYRQMGFIERISIAEQNYIGYIQLHIC